MNDALAREAGKLDLASPANEPLRLAFGLACGQRIAHLLEDQDVIACLHALERHLDGSIDRLAFDGFVTAAARLASSHRGSVSIDGCGHAAVSASFAVARALAGDALQAADYAAYAMVYAQGGYGAVAERAAFDPEFAWQARTLGALARGREAAE